MSKKVISSLSDVDLKILSDMATYLLSLHGKKSVSPSKSAAFLRVTDSVVFRAEEIAVLKKLKHLHVLSYEKK